jgi:hypothetical protein
MRKTDIDEPALVIIFSKMIDSAKRRAAAQREKSTNK